MPLAICAVHQVPAFANVPLDHIISIREVHQPGTDISAFQHNFSLHRFVFADTGDPTNPLAVTNQMMQRLIDIYKTTTPQDKMLFHCFGGVSRSTAAAFLWLVHHGMEYETAYATVVAVRGPFVCPNQLMVKLADPLMGHEGKMTAFLNAELGRRLPEREAYFKQFG